MKLHLILPLLFISNFLFSQTPFEKLIDRFDEIKASNEEKIRTISNLTNQVNDLMAKKTRDRKEIKKQREEIQLKSEEILVLRGEILNAKFTLEQVLFELNLLKDENTEFKNIIKELESEKQQQAERLLRANDIIEKLLSELKNSKFENDLLIAKNEALERRVNELLEIPRFISFIEVSSLSNYGYQLSASRGLLFKGNNLYGSAKVNYTGYSYSGNKVSLVGLNGQIIVPIYSGRNFNFKYIEKDEPIYRNLKYFLSLDAGWSFPINKLESVKYYGGINFQLSIGAIIPVTDNVQPFVHVGLKNEAFDLNSQGVDTNGFMTMFQIGTGAHF